MPYATNGAVSQTPIEGGIEISEAQYKAAINGMIAGQVVTINGGFSVIDKPEPKPAPEPEVPEPTPEELDAVNVLTPPRFRFMLALNGWEDVWESAEDYLRAHDRPGYAQLVAQKAAANYRLSATLAFVAAMQPIIAQVAPDVDLSEDAIRAAWDEAKTVVLHV